MALEAELLLASRGGPDRSGADPGAAERLTAQINSLRAAIVDVRARARTVQPSAAPLVGFVLPAKPRPGQPTSLNSAPSRDAATTHDTPR
jgi:hypothetical protein